MMTSGLLAQSVVAGLLALVGGAWMSKATLRLYAKGMALLSLVQVFWMWSTFDLNVEGLQWVEKWRWMDTLGVHFALGLDGIALALVLMTVVVTCSTVWMENALGAKAHVSIGVVFLTQAVAVGLFGATDGITFYVFWEASLIPLFLSIGIEGSVMRKKAAMKFFLYTFLASALFLPALLYMGLKAGDFQMAAWPDLPLSFTEQMVLSGISLFAAMVKLPLVPVHTWLPDAHPEAPTYGSMLLAATMLKFGTYALLRIVLPVFPDACLSLAPWMMGGAVFTLWYAGCLAWCENDAKRLIAYSSIAHMAMTVFGLFLVHMLPESSVLEIGVLAVMGCVFQMFAHAISACGLFGGFGMLYSRLHTRKVSSLSGIAKVMPFFSALMFLVLFNNIALPGTSGFVGELLITLAAFQSHPFLALAATSSLLVTATYSLRFVREVFYGPVLSYSVSQLKDVTLYQSSALLGLCLLALGLGCMPSVLGDLLDRPCAALVKSTINYKHDTGGEA